MSCQLPPHPTCSAMRARGYTVVARCDVPSLSYFHTPPVVNAQGSVCLPAGSGSAPRYPANTSIQHIRRRTHARTGARARWDASAFNCRDLAAYHLCTAVLLLVVRPRRACAWGDEVADAAQRLVEWKVLSGQHRWKHVRASTQACRAEPPMSDYGSCV